MSLLRYFLFHKKHLVIVFSQTSISKKVYDKKYVLVCVMPCPLVVTKVGLQWVVFVI